MPFSIRNISYNNFSGVVPLSRNFSRFTPDRYSFVQKLACFITHSFALVNDLLIATISFVGNPLLCGDWRGSICDPYAPKSKGMLHFCALESRYFGIVLSCASK